MPRIIAYQYDADRYCPACAVAAFGHVCPTPDEGTGFTPGTPGLRMCSDCPMLDENGIPSEPRPLDSEGNAISALTAYDEWWSDPDAYETLECANYGSDVRSRVPMHVAFLAEHEPITPRCPCGDGCAEGDCGSCDDDDRDMDDEETNSNCSCPACLAASAYIEGSDDAHYDEPTEALALFTDNAFVDVPASLVLPVTQGAAYALSEDAEARNVDIITIAWADDSATFGGRGADCPSIEPDQGPYSFSYNCERVLGHSGQHGAFGSERRTGQGERRTW